MHAGYVHALLSSGTRGQAWRYALEMLPCLPWGWRLVLRALVFGVLGVRLAGAAAELSKA